jgi:hypothetical protein
VPTLLGDVTRRRATMDRPMQDPQDKAFGASAAADQEFVDELLDEGATDEQVPDPVGPPPRAAGKALPPG